MIDDLLVVRLTHDQFTSKKHLHHFPCLLIYDSFGTEFLRYVIGPEETRGNYYDYAFAINNRSKPDYSGQDGSISKEKFVDLVRDNYPDCFDWFLWNPGWL